MSNRYTDWKHGDKAVLVEYPIFKQQAPYMSSCKAEISKRRDNTDIDSQIEYVCSYVDLNGVAHEKRGTCKSEHQARLNCRIFAESMGYTRCIDVTDGHIILSVTPEWYTFLKGYWVSSNRFLEEEYGDMLLGENADRDFGALEIIKRMSPLLNGFVNTKRRKELRIPHDLLIEGRCIVESLDFMEVDAGSHTPFVDIMFARVRSTVEAYRGIQQMVSNGDMPKSQIKHLVAKRDKETKRLGSWNKTSIVKLLKSFKKEYGYNHAYSAVILGVDTGNGMSVDGKDIQNTDYYRMNSSEDVLFLRTPSTAEIVSGNVDWYGEFFEAFTIYTKNDSKSIIPLIKEAECVYIAVLATRFGKRTVHHAGVKYDLPVLS